MRDFEALTAREKVRRLSLLVERALVQYGKADVSVALLATSYNTVFRVRCHGQSYVCRVAPAVGAHAAGVYEAERAWTVRMATAGAAVPMVLPTLDGAASTIVTQHGVPGRRACTLLTWVPGRPLRRPGHQLTAGDAADLGRLAARLHDLAPHAGAPPDGVLDGRNVLLFAVPDRLGELRARYGGLFDAARDDAQAAVAWCWDHRGSPRVHHGDLTWNNVVRGRGGLVAVDCQDLTWGTVEQDLAATVYAVTAGGTDHALLEPFRRAYSSQRHFPDIPRDVLIGLLTARRLQMVNLALTLGRPAVRDYLDDHAAALRG